MGGAVEAESKKVLVGPWVPGKGEREQNMAEVLQLQSDMMKARLQ